MAAGQASLHIAARPSRYAYFHFASGAVALAFYGGGNLLVFETRGFDMAPAPAYTAHHRHMLGITY